MDPLIAGFTDTGAQMIDPEFIANPAMNYYFLIASTFVLVPTAVFVTTKIVEPRLGKYEGKIETLDEVTSVEKKGLRWW